jgi:hypothetical protein
MQYLVLLKKGHKGKRKAFDIQMTQKLLLQKGERGVSFAPVAESWPESLSGKEP